MTKNRDRICSKLNPTRIPHLHHLRCSALAHLVGKVPDARPTPTIVSTMFVRMGDYAGEQQKH